MQACLLRGASCRFVSSRGTLRPCRGSSTAARRAASGRPALVPKASLRTEASTSSTEDLVLRNDRLRPPPTAPSFSGSSTATATADRPPRQGAPPLSLSDSPLSLWDDTHIPSWSPWLALYFPLGCLLAPLRILLWCAGVLLDRPSFQTRGVAGAWLALLGVKVTWKHLERLPAGRHVLVSNHSTPCDLLALFTLPRRYVHLITPGMPAIVTRARNLPVLLRPATLGMFDQLATAGSSAEDQDAPIHLFPEGGLTNGSGMMVFTRGFMKFAAGLPVVPVALRASAPLGLRTHTLLSSFPANLWWFSFAPFVELEATVLAPLPPLGRGAAGRARGEYVQRAQQAIADELGVPVREVGIKEKRRIMEQRRTDSAK